MAEDARIRYGRVLESADIAGITAQRAFDTTRQLLDSGDWTQLGFDTVDAFIRSVPFGNLNPPLELRHAYELVAADHGATQKAIGESAGVSESQVNRDLSRNGRSKTDQASETEGSQPPSLPQRETIMLCTHDGTPVEYPAPRGRSTFNLTEGPGISWAQWSWNPVTGCLHGCRYCYAREIATSGRSRAGFPVGFTPLFHSERLDAPANTTIPAAHHDDPAYRRVFVCSMADLYGRWVPNDWIKQVHAAMNTNLQWEYLLLTKFPARYVKLDLPPTAWVGTSVDEQRRVRIAEDAFRKIGGVKVKWLSLEPLLEPLEFSDLSMFDWVVIGAQTETRQPDGVVEAFAPPFEWVARLCAQARDAGCKVHLKPNLADGKPGMQLPDEYPELVP